MTSDRIPSKLELHSTHYSDENVKVKWNQWADTWICHQLLLTLELASSGRRCCDQLIIFQRREGGGGGFAVATLLLKHRVVSWKPDAMKDRRVVPYRRCCFHFVLRLFRISVNRINHCGSPPFWTKFLVKKLDVVKNFFGLGQVLQCCFDFNKWRRLLVALDESTCANHQPTAHRILTGRWSLEYE